MLLRIIRSKDCEMVQAKASSAEVHTFCAQWPFTVNVAFNSKGMRRNSAVLCVDPHSEGQPSSLIASSLLDLLYDFVQNKPMVVLWLLISIGWLPNQAKRSHSPSIE